MCLQLLGVIFFFVFRALYHLKCHKNLLNVIAFQSLSWNILFSEIESSESPHK